MTFTSVRWFIGLVPGGLHPAEDQRPGHEGHLQHRLPDHGDEKLGLIK
jgi:hypothetical protein